MNLDPVWSKHRLTSLQAIILFIFVLNIITTIRHKNVPKVYLLRWKIFSIKEYHYFAIKISLYKKATVSLFASFRCLAEPQKIRRNIGKFFKVRRSWPRVRDTYELFTLVVFKSFQITDATRVCSQHFNDCDIKKTLAGKRILVNDAVSSVFEWTTRTKTTRPGPKQRVCVTPVVELTVTGTSSSFL